MKRRSSVDPKRTWLETRAERRSPESSLSKLPHAFRPLPGSGEDGVGVSGQYYAQAPGARHTRIGNCSAETRDPPTIRSKRIREVCPCRLGPCTMQPLLEQSYTHFFSPQFISSVFLEHLLNVRLCERHWRNTKMKKELGSTRALQDEAYSQAAQQVRLSDGNVCGLLSLFRAKTQNPAVSKS